MIQKLCVMKSYMLWILYQQKMTNTIATNATSTVSINCRCKIYSNKLDYIKLDSIKQMDLLQFRMKLQSCL